MSSHESFPRDHPVDASFAIDRVLADDGLVQVAGDLASLLAARGIETEGIGQAESDARQAAPQCRFRLTCPVRR